MIVLLFYYIAKYKYKAYTPCLIVEIQLINFDNNGKVFRKILKPVKNIIPVSDISPIHEESDEKETQTSFEYPSVNKYIQHTPPPSPPQIPREKTPSPKQKTPPKKKTPSPKQQSPPPKVNEKNKKNKIKEDSFSDDFSQSDSFTENSPNKKNNNNLSNTYHSSTHNSESHGISKETMQEITDLTRQNGELQTENKILQDLNDELHSEIQRYKDV